METLAFLHASINYENPESYEHPESDLPLPPAENGRSPISHPVVAGMTGGAVVLSAMIMAPGSQAVVKRGDACAAVRSVQTALQQKGYNPGQVDGVFGPTTEAATIEFQRRNNLPADGQVGVETATALGVGAAESASSPFRDGACGESNSTTAIASGGATSSSSTSRANTVRIRTNGNPLNVRSGPGTNYSVIGVISNGIQVRVGESSNGWLRLAEREGWIAAQWTTGSSGSSSSGSSSGSGSSGGSGGSSGTVSGSIRIATNGRPLNVRSGPGTSYGVIGVVSNGTVVNTTGRTSGQWVELSRGGWVVAEWTNLGGVRQGSGGATRRAVVSTNGRALNLRSSPNGRVIGSLPNRTGLQLSGRRSGGWVEVVSSDRGQTRGWMSEQWIRYQ